MTSLDITYKKSFAFLTDRSSMFTATVNFVSGSRWPGMVGPSVAFIQSQQLAAEPADTVKK